MKTTNLVTPAIAAKAIRAIVNAQMDAVVAEVILSPTVTIGRDYLTWLLDDHARLTEYYINSRSH